MIKYLEVATIYVTDQDRARDFYVNKLGFKPRGEMEMPGGMRWVEVLPEGSATSFSLVVPRSDEERVGKHSGFVFATDDIDTAYKQLTERGVNFTQPPTFQGWGTYSEFEDLDGNLSGLASVEQSGNMTQLIKGLQVASIAVTDQDRARDFYVNKLGFKLINEMEVPGGMRWLAVAPEGSQVSFSLEPVSATEQSLGKHTGFVFTCDDLDATYKELSERGVNFVQPPTFLGWGTYSEFEDLDGNRIGLAKSSNVARS